MGTDSKYLEEAMAELERSLETFSDNVEITSLIVNNLENRLDEAKSLITNREANEMNIQGGKTDLIALFNEKFERDNVFDSVYWTKLPNNEYWRINIEELFSKIWWLEQQIDDEFLYDNIVNAKTYMRYYKNNTCEFDLRYMSYACKRTHNYVEREKQKDRLTIYEHKNNITKNKVTAKDIETGKKVYKYVVTYRSKPILVEDTGRYITLETGCYKWVEE